MKKVKKIIIVLVLFLSLISSSEGFDSNANRVNPSDPNDRRQREYTRDNASLPLGQGGYYGGHDTITAEGLLLKEQVHKQTDGDGGSRFIEEFSSKALPYLRTGAHDEDTNKYLNPILNDPPIGPNGWGDFFNHFYDPNTGEGLSVGGVRVPGSQPATQRAMDYLKEIMQRTGCSPNAISKLSLGDRQRVYDYFGRILHLIEDMGVPSHTKNDIHIATEPFEKYVNDNWNQVINSEAFKGKVTVDSYLNGGYGLNNSIDPREYMKALAERSKNYYSQEEIYDWVWDSTQQRFVPVVNQERLMKNVDDLIPETIKYVSGYIDAIYQYMSGSEPGGLDPNILKICDRPPDPSSPANDHPDDRFDVSDEFYWEKEFGLTVADLMELYLRTAIKKGKVGVWYGKRFREIFIEGRALYKDASQELKDVFELEFRVIKERLQGRGEQLESDWRGAPDIALFANGFYNPSISLMLKIGEPVSFQKIDFDPKIVRDHPVMLVPTGGFYGLKNSAAVKALLDEYVKKGGTLVVFTQQHGYDWNLLPTPANPETGERRPVAGYGYQEDQSCQFNSVYIDTYHPILSTFSTSTTNIGVDGYFTSYPDNSTILLRRISNGQPAMIMYPYGEGYVIAATIYSDFALAHHQINQTEINFIQNIISWAKKPKSLLELRPGEEVNLNLEVANFMDVDATSIRFTILDPSRKVVNEQTHSISIPAGRSLTIPITYMTTSTSTLGIYHVDYTLLDGQGKIIQPQAETDSGRFVVSNPVSNPYKSPDFGFSVLSDAEYYVYGSPATFTFILWNHTEVERRITVKGNLSHHNVWIVRTVSVPPKGSASFNYILERVINFDRCFTWFYDESGKQVGLQSKGIWMVYPSAKVTVATDKGFYGKNQSVKITTAVTNGINIGWQPFIKVTVRDLYNYKVFEETKAVNLSPLGAQSIAIDFFISSSSRIGSYLVEVEVFYGLPYIFFSIGAYTRFEVLGSQISTVVVMPPLIDSGSNTISFALTNMGRVDVSSGVLDVSFKDPDGDIIYSGGFSFSLVSGQSKSVDVPISIPSIKFGNYTLVYSQSDETKTGNPTTLIIPSMVSIICTFDKSSYRVRETANLTIDLKNFGKFNFSDSLITVSAPSMGYSESKTVSLLPGQDLQLMVFISIPETISSVKHSVDVRFSIASGAEMIKSMVFPIRKSELSIEHSGVTVLKPGDMISLTIENTGGMDTTYRTERFFIRDSRGVIIYQANNKGGVFAGEKRIFSKVQIPSQTMNGLVYVEIVILDDKTGEKVYFSKGFEIVGLTGSLKTRTDKEVYLKAESIIGFTTLTNGSYGIEGGSLKLAIVGNEPVEFSHFLPRTGWWPFYNPRGIAVGPDGSVYVADSDNHRIQKFDSNGNFITKWGSIGLGDGEFARPEGIAIGSDGSVFVTDVFNNRVQKFDSNGAFITKWGNYCVMDVDDDGTPDQLCEGGFYLPRSIAIGPDGSVYVSDSSNHRVQKFDGNGVFMTQWGSMGSEERQFNIPRGIAVDSSGFVYVVDSGNCRIQKFDSHGNFVHQWGNFGFGNGQFYFPNGIAIGTDGYVYVSDFLGDCIQKFDSSGNFVMKWGTSGSGDGQLSGIEGIAIGSGGYLFVTEIGNQRIQKFDLNGNFIKRWGSGGNDDGLFLGPNGVAIDSDGFIYVADTYNNRIQKFNPNGNFVRKWGEYGWGDGQFYYPINVAISSDGFVYVVDFYNHRIQKFDSDGQFITKWGGYCITDVDEDGVLDDPCNGKFYYPKGIAIGTDSSVYVSEIGNNRIQRFDSNGNFIMKWGNAGVGEGEFQWPCGIAIGSDGAVFVTDNLNHRIQKFDSNGGFIAQWGSLGRGDGQFSSPSGITISSDGYIYVADSGNNRIQKFNLNGDFIAQWGRFDSDDRKFIFPDGVTISPDGFVYVADTYNNRIQKMSPSTFFEAFHPINQLANTTQEYIINIGTINTTGKLSLQATLTNDLGQTIAKGSYPFYIIEEDTVLLLDTDKKAYRSGETMTITGQVENRAAIEAVGLTLTLYGTVSNRSLPNSELLYTETFNIPAGGSHPFTITTTAAAEGAVTLIGTVRQNDSILVEIKDQYEVVKPEVSVSVGVPEVVGNEEFSMIVEIKNGSKVEAILQFGVQGSEFVDKQTILIPPGGIKLLQYSQQITENVTYTFTFSGDLNQNITKTVIYGLGASITIDPHPLYPEGNVSVPVTITNTGQLAETIVVNFELNAVPLQSSKSYYLPAGASATEILNFSLTEGDYQITATSQKPDAFAQASFSVRKENQAEMSVSLGTQTDGLIPVNVNLTNLGFNEISGNVNVSVSSSTGETVWTGVEPVSQLSPQGSQLLTLNINPSAFDPGNYNVQVTLLSNSNQPISTQSSSFGVQSASFQITHLPSYQTFYPEHEAIFIFRVKNTGNQEGAFELNFRAYELINSVQREWLKPGEEKAITFSFILPEDLEEKDYFASYELKDSRSQGVEGSRGQIKYHLAGIALNVNATLDKPYYMEGETAHLTISIQSPNPNPQNLFARVNYAGYELQQTFTLSGNQVLIFDVPLPKITGEKLFYGIYHEGGRSIHLNSLYIYKAGDVITITTDKQVYNPEETVYVTVSGNASGNMTLSGPGGYTETFQFSGQVTKSLTLPSTMISGTYFIHATLEASNPGTITVSHPFDVAGIQVKVLECQNDKDRYAPSDTIVTHLSISSNTAMPAILKAWIVDPTGQYISVGEQNISLSSSENSLITLHSSLITEVSGIHRLVYGIYGPEEILLCSGSEAFDVGEIVVLGLVTDKKDYPTNTEPVIVMVSLFGSVNADLQLYLDGTLVKSQSISLNGFATYTTELQNIAPGPHILKAILTAGGLRSSKETSFTYALAFMPRPQISVYPAHVDFGKIKLGITSTETITLSSTGNADLVIGTISLSGPNQGEFSIQNDTCSGRTISPSGTCALNILFSPTSLGAKSASLFIPSNATATPTLTLALSGTGVTTLNLSINPGGSGKVTGTGMDCPGDCTETYSTSGVSVQLTATPSEGYRFVNWTGDIDSTDNPIAITMETHKSVIANFAINIYTITATANLGGIISPSGSITVNYGGSQTFNIIPNPGYHVEDVKVNGISVGPVTTFTFDNITANHIIEVTFKVNDHPPVANPGQDQNAITGQVVTLNGSESYDPEGSLITFLWTFVELPEGSRVSDSSLTDATSAKPQFIPDVDGAYVIKLIVSDGERQGEDEVTIFATTPNVAPNADAGPDQNVLKGSIVYLDGSKSNDPDNRPEPLTYLWSFITKPSNSNLTDNEIANRNTFLASFIPDADGLYEIMLVVSDGEFKSEDTVQIFATAPNVPPNANAGEDITIYLGQTALLDGSKSNDPDNGPQPLSYLWRFVSVPQGSKLGNENIMNPNSVSPSFTPDVTGTYVLELTVYDGKDAGFDNVAVTVVEKSYKISGGAYFFPENNIIYRASFSMDVTGPSFPSGWFKYYYTRTRMNFVSTAITSVSLSGNTAVISGTGTVNGAGGYTFMATVVNGSPDSFTIVIKKSDGSTYYSAGPKNISGGDLVFK